MLWFYTLQAQSRQNLKDESISDEDEEGTEEKVGGDEEEGSRGVDHAKMTSNTTNSSVASKRDQSSLDVCPSLGTDSEPSSDSDWTLQMERTTPRRRVTLLA